MWRLEGNSATLRLGPLTAKLNLLQPSAGLLEVTYADNRLQQDTQTPFALMRVLTDQEDQQRDEPLRDRYIRGCDLIASYAGTPQRAVLPLIYWRARSGGCDVPTVDLLLSLETASPESRARVRVACQLRGELWRCNLDTCEFERLTRVGGRLHQGGELLLVRLPGLDVSYAQMIHRRDFRGVDVAAGDAGTGAISLEYPVFDENLEKGVIRRSRLRGLVARRQGSGEAALGYASRSLTAFPP